MAMSKFDSTSPMPYEKLLKNLEIVKARLQRPLTLSEKILYSHLDDPHNQGELCTQSISDLVLTLIGMSYESKKKMLIFHLGAFFIRHNELGRASN